MSEYIEITPSGEIADAREPFRFVLDGKKFELPALDSADVPLPLIQSFLLMNAGPVTQNQQMQIAAAFIGYIEIDHPKLWALLRRKDHALAWVLGLIEQWGAHSRMDPQLPPSGS